MSKKYLPLTDPIFDYIQTVSVREPEVLKRLREETAKLAHSSMQISPDQGQFMALLVQIGVLKARHLRQQLGDDVLDLTRRSKTALDPEGILNPGKWI